MKLIVGLGNIGQEYAHSKHNIGFDVVDLVAKKENLEFLEEKKFKCYLTKGRGFILMKPTTYMNLSGDALILVKNYYNIDNDDILVIQDDLDMEVAKLRYRVKGSSGGHNGLKSIMSHVGTDFRRVKIGIGRSDKSVINQVLSRFNSEERLLIDESIEKAASLVIDFIKNVDDKEITNKYN